MNSPEPTSDAADQAKGLYGNATDKVKDLYDEAADKSKELLNQVPDSVKNAGGKAGEAFKNLTTTQKVVGGALLAAGLVYLVAPKKKGKAKRAKKALDTLLLYVNDRIEGYKRAVAESKDASLKSYYQQLVSQSQQFANTLNSYLTKKGGERESGTTLKGKLYRKLMDAQAVVTNRDEKAILAANVHGEMWALKAYKQALRRKALKGDLREAVKKQFAASRETYKKLKELTAQQH
ncbi:MAG: PA2169 family four-helix-bundle protein [Hymenobacter sp.]|nr:MAG: PA2169 family four-helix-bundle protein [Hymenobacter sp.]